MFNISSHPDVDHDKSSGFPAEPDKDVVNLFTHVASIQDCITQLAGAGFLQSGSLDEANAGTICSICTELRLRHLEMEPNLLGRTACEAIASSSVAGHYCIRLAALDTDVAPLITAADLARDAHDFARGQVLYSQAVGYYPKHPALRVQLAHCFKERGNFHQSLLHYFDALACGAPLPDIMEHATFVADKLSISDKVVRSLAFGCNRLLSDEVAAIHELFLGSSPSMESLLLCMCDFPTLERISVYLVNKDAFHEANRSLLRLMNETGWGPFGA